MVKKISNEKREFIRFKIDVPVCCKVNDEQTIKIGTTDISSQGLSFEWSGSLPDLSPGALLRLDISGESIPQPLQALAKVVWIRRGKGFKNCLGLCFVKDRKSKIPIVICYGSNFYWDIFKKTGSIIAYLLYKMESQ